MQFSCRFSAVVGLLLLSLGVVAFAADSTGGQKKKADFLTEKEQNFIRPGLNLEILQASITGSTAKFTFRVSDSRGAGLDIDGIETPGPITVRPVLSYIAQGQTFYTAYTKSTATSPSGVSAEQAARDRNGTFQPMGDGVYEYTFGTSVPGGFDSSATHTVAAWANRDLEEFELGEASAADTIDWVPSGAPVTIRRQIVKDESCNACHGELSAHDNRTTVAVCITCHSPQSTDPDTGNSVDFTQMVHKIHRGADLPSVQAGTPYQIIGLRGSVHDYSTVEFPGDVRACSTRHIQDDAAVPAPLTTAAARLSPRSRSSRTDRSAAQSSATRQQQSLEANHHLLNPSQRACGSCHDDVNFATGENHASLPQISDNQCSNCHTPQGELEFDISIIGAHTVERFSRDLPGTNFEILGVTNTAPGRQPTVTFNITNDAGSPVSPANMGRLALVLAGGNGTDYNQFYSENATSASGGGPFTHTFNQAIPTDAVGSWSVGTEGYQNAVLLPDTLQERSVRDAGDNVVFYFDVNGGPARARRAVVATQKCNACHLDLDLHGSNRNNVEHCVACHNPTTTDVARRPADQGDPEGVNFKDMIHRIHNGEELTRDVTIFGFGGTPHNYNEVRFPNSRANCASCHLDGTESLPLAANTLASNNPRDLISPTPPATAACLSCHTRVSAAAHADLNISERFGESCDVCHGIGAEFAVDRLHAAE